MTDERTKRAKLRTAGSAEATFRRRVDKANAERVEAIVAARDAGASLAEIGAAIGMTKMGVSKLLDRQ